MSHDGRLTQAKLAVIMLTRLPAGRLSEPASSLADAAWAYPLVGLPVGVLVWAVFAAALSLGLSAPGAAVLALIAAALVTGALHHDGLADFADGLGGGRDRAHCLEIMRDSRIGSYGVIALVLGLGWQATSLADLGPSAQLWQFCLIAVGSRLAMTAALVGLAPARDDGLGRSSGVTVKATLVPGTVATVLLGAFIGAPALWALLAMALAGLWVARIAHRRIGGQTGDVLGAVQLTTEIAGWAALAVMVG